MGFAHNDDRLPSELDINDSAQKRHHRKRRLHINENPAQPTRASTRTCKSAGDTNGDNGTRTDHQLGFLRNDH